MKVLLDQNVPKKLRLTLKGHLVMTALQMGWAEIENGSLIRLAEGAGFNVLVTGDQNIVYQQKNESRVLALVVIPTINWAAVRENLDEIAAAVDSAAVGSYRRVEILKTRHRIDGAPV